MICLEQKTIHFLRSFYKLSYTCCAPTAITHIAVTAIYFKESKKAVEDCIDMMETYVYIVVK